MQVKDLPGITQCDPDSGWVNASNRRNLRCALSSGVLVIGNVICRVWGKDDAQYKAMVLGCLATCF